MRDINFFSSYVKSSALKDNKKNIALASAGFLFIGIILVCLINMFRINNMKKEIAEIEKYLTSKDNISRLKEYQAVRNKVEILNEYESVITEVIDTLNNKKKINSFVFDAFSSTFPSNVYVKSMAITNGVIQMNGLTDSIQSIAELEHNIEINGTFEQIQVASIQSKQDGGYNFTLKCTIKDVNN